ncbi:hypothetical protein ZOSMA_306G00090 [Zostera marina]|uniref:SWIM-type domain-containing protein n=1 Tax=Zostera marina TaxID=29655 RepID=A0A0K9PAA6_ZOSMR|nr:hypothetical protein ZOSMA_306G00090 [Zostera marina]
MKQYVGIFTQIVSARLHTLNGFQLPTCSCGMFTSKNIPCRHIISLLNFFSITSLPSSFISNRWKRTVRKSDAPIKPNAFKANVELNSLFYKFAALASQDPGVEIKILESLKKCLTLVEGK